MEALPEAIRRFYSGFILRDFLGKIVPGSVALLGVALAVTNQGVWHLLTASRNDLGALPGVIQLLGVGFLWLVGLVVQGFRELIELVSSREERVLGSAERVGWPEAQREEIERVVVIKESAGNGALAFLVLFAGTLSGPGWPGWLWAVLAASSLAYFYWSAWTSERDLHDQFAASRA